MPASAETAPPACLNCGAVLHGRYCSHCAQSADDHHRPILRLIWEGIEGITHLDGRLATTLPPLLFRPGKLARDHLEGRRARHVPPFRLFLVTLLVFMLALESVIGAGFGGRPTMVSIRTGAQTKVVPATPSQIADMMTGARTPAEIAGEPETEPISPKARKAIGGVEAWIGGKIRRAAANPEYFQMVVFTWAHRLAVLLLPIFAAQLALLYFWRRKFYFYDHLVVSMQFLSFAFVIFAIAWLPPEPVRGALIGLAFLWLPVNLFMLLRGAYGSGVFGAAVRTVWLWLSTLVVFTLLVIGLLFLGLQQL
jgi:hypothetical protein